MDIIAISGSLSETSSNSAVLRLVRDAASPPDRVVLFELLDDIPHFSPHRDREPAPAAVTALRDAIRSSDAVLIATPEYAGGMPGVLKNALDWLVGSGDLDGKAAVVVSVAPSAHRGRGARASLELTLRMQGARVCDSFTVAGTGALVEAAAELFDRAQRVLAGGSCADAAQV